MRNRIIGYSRTIYIFNDRIYENVIMKILEYSVQIPSNPIELCSSMQTIVPLPNTTEIHTMIKAPTLFYRTIVLFSITVL